MIKVISFGTNSPDNRINIIQRNGKRVCLALAIEIDVISERLEDLTSQAAVNFSIEEVPEKAARKVIADTEEGGQAALILEYGKPVDPVIHRRVADFVGKCVRAYPTG